MPPSKVDSFLPDFLLRISSPSRSPSVVRCINDQGIVGNFQSFKRIKDSSHVVIEFLNGIAIFAPFGSSLEFFAHPERNVQHGVRQVKEERFFLFRSMKSRASSVQTLVNSLTSAGRFTTLPLHQGHASLVLEKDRLDGVEVVQQAEVVVEPLIVWKKGFMKPEVPFSDAGGLVAIVLSSSGRVNSSG